jgi:DNA-binding MarR family transcriptional regulator
MSEKTNGKKNGAAVSDLEDHLGFWIHYVSNHVSADFARRLSKSGVSVSEWVALRRLYELGDITQHELAASMGITKGPVSRILDRLVAKKLVGRSESPLDVRANVIHLTKTGRRMVPKLAQIADKNDRDFFAPLADSDRKAIVRIMRKLVEQHNLVCETPSAQAQINA